MDILIAVLALAWLSLAIAGVFRPGFLLVLVVSFFIVEQIYAYRFSSNYLSNRKFIDLLTGFVVLSILLWRGRISLLRFQGASVYGNILFVFCIASAAWSISQDITVERWLEVLPLTVLCAVLGPLCIETSSDLKDFLFGFMVLGFIACLIYAFGDRSGRGLALETNVGNAELGPLAAAQFAGIYSIACTFAIFLTRPPLAAKVVFVFGALLGVYVNASTGSRGQLLALAPIMVLILPSTISRRKVSVSSFVALIAGVLLCYVAYEVVIEFGFDDRWKASHIESGISSRTEMIERLIVAFAESGPSAWLLGLGSSSSYTVAGFYCHVVAIEVITELGLVGFAIYLIYHFTLLKEGRRALAYCEDHDLRICLLLVMTSFCRSSRGPCSAVQHSAISIVHR